MWPFKKKGFVDLTEDLNVPNSGSVVSNIKPSRAYSEERYKDLTGTSASTFTTDNASALGFLGNLASSASSSDSASPILTRGSRNSFEHLKVKIEDVEYKINALRSRVDKILDRLELTEKKLDRFERA